MDEFKLSLERDIEENKVLGDMLPKIEGERKLALYLFELERRIDKLEDEIRKLRTQ